MGKKNGILSVASRMKNRILSVFLAAVLLGDLLMVPVLADDNDAVGTENELPGAENELFGTENELPVTENELPGTENEPEDGEGNANIDRTDVIKADDYPISSDTDKAPALGKGETTSLSAGSISSDGIKPARDGGSISSNMAPGDGQEGSFTATVKVGENAVNSVYQDDSPIVAVGGFSLALSGIESLQSLQLELIRLGASKDDDSYGGDYQEYYDKYIIKTEVTFDKDGNAAEFSGFDLHDYMVDKGGIPVPAGSYRLRIRADIGSGVYKDYWAASNLRVEWKSTDGPYIGTEMLDEGYVDTDYSMQLNATPKTEGNTLEWAFLSRYGFDAGDWWGDGCSLSLSSGGELKGHLPAKIRGETYSRVWIPLSFRVREKESGEYSDFTLPFRITDENKKKNVSWTVTATPSSKIPEDSADYEFEAKPNMDVPFPKSNDTIVTGIEFTCPELFKSLDAATIAEKISEVSINGNSYVDKDKLKITKSRSVITIGFTEGATVTELEGLKFKISGLTNPVNSFSGYTSSSFFTSQDGMQYISDSRNWDVKLRDLYAKVTVTGLNEGLKELSPRLTAMINGNVDIKDLGVPEGNGNYLYLSKSDLGKTATFKLSCTDSAFNTESIETEVTLNESYGPGEGDDIVLPVEIPVEINAGSIKEVHTYTIKTPDNISAVLLKSADNTALKLFDGKVKLFTGLSQANGLKAYCSTVDLEVKKKYDLSKSSVSVEGSEISVDCDRLMTITETATAIKGKVTAEGASAYTGHKAGDPIANASVAVSQTIGDYTLAARAFTDKSGNYEIKGQLYRGYPVKIKVSATGFDEYPSYPEGQGVTVPYANDLNISLNPGAGVISVSLNQALADGTPAVVVRTGSDTGDIVRDTRTIWDDSLRSAVVTLPSGAGSGPFYLTLMQGGVQLGESVTVTLPDNKAVFDNTDQGVLNLNETATDRGTMQYKAYVYDGTTGKLAYEFGSGTGVYSMAIKSGTYAVLLLGDICPIMATKLDGGSTAYRTKDEMVAALNGLYGGQGFSELYCLESVIIEKGGETRFPLGKAVPYNKLINYDTSDSSVEIPKTANLNSSWKVAGTVRSREGKKHSRLMMLCNDPQAVYGIAVNGSPRQIGEENINGGWGIYADVSDLLPPYRFTIYMGGNNSSTWKKGFPTVRVIEEKVLLIPVEGGEEKAIVLKSGSTTLTPRISIKAPARSAKETVDFGGEAEPGREVTIYDNGLAAARVMPDRYGQYSGTLALDTDFMEHALTAVEEIKEGTDTAAVSDTCHVSYCPEEAALERLYIRKGNDSAITLRLDGKGISYSVPSSGAYNDITLGARISNPEMLDSTTLAGEEGSVTKKLFFKVYTLGGIRYLPAEDRGSGLFEAKTDFGTDYPRFIKAIYRSRRNSDTPELNWKYSSVTYEKAYKMLTGKEKNGGTAINPEGGIRAELASSGVSDEQLDEQKGFLSDVFTNIVKKMGDKLGRGGENIIKSVKKIEEGNEGKEAESAKKYNVFSMYMEPVRSIPSYVDKSEKVKVDDGKGNKVEQYTAIRFFDKDGKEVKGVVQEKKEEKLDGETLAYNVTKINEKVKSVMTEVYWSYGNVVLRTRLLACEKGIKKSPLEKDASLSLQSEGAIRAEGDGGMKKVTGAEMCVQEINDAGITADTGYSVATAIYGVCSTSVGLALEDEFAKIAIETSGKAGVASNSVKNATISGTKVVDAVGSGSAIGTYLPGLLSMDTGHEDRLNGCADNYDKMRSTGLKMYRELAEAEKSAKGHTKNEIAALKKEIKGFLNDVGEGDSELGQAMVNNELTGKNTKILDVSGTVLCCIPYSPCAVSGAMASGASAWMKVDNDRKVSNTVKSEEANRYKFGNICERYNKVCGG